MDDENDALDDGAFFKALQSDVDDAVSLKLLMEVYETNELWAGQFTHNTTHTPVTS